MTEEIIINKEICSRYWNGSCTGDNGLLIGACLDIDCKIKQILRLKQENERLKEINHKMRLGCLKCEYKNTKADVEKYRSALEEIRGKVNQSYQMADRHIVLNIINEVLNESK